MPLPEKPLFCISVWSVSKPVDNLCCFFPPSFIFYSCSSSPCGHVQVNSNYVGGGSVVLLAMASQSCFMRLYFIIRNSSQIV